MEAWLDCAESFKGAKTVRNGRVWEESPRANGLAGEGEECRAAVGRAFEEKGSRYDISEDKGGFFDRDAGGP